MLVAPVPRWGIVMGQALGGTSLAVVQGLLFLVLAPAVGIPLSLAAVAGTLVVMLVVALALTSLGLIIAWRMDSTQGFHAIMNLLLMPMWLLSGSFFPPSGAPSWVQWIIRANPLTYGVAAIRRALYLGELDGKADLPSFAVCIAVTCLFGALAFAATTRTAR